MRRCPIRFFELLGAMGRSPAPPNFSAETRINFLSVQRKKSRRLSFITGKNYSYSFNLMLICIFRSSPLLIVAFKDVGPKLELHVFFLIHNFALFWIQAKQTNFCIFTWSSNTRDVKWIRNPDPLGSVVFLKNKLNRMNYFAEKKIMTFLLLKVE